MSWIKVVGINIILMSLVVMAIELTYGGWIFSEQKNSCSYLLCSVDLEYESEFTGKTRYTKDKFGLRNRGGVDSNIDLLIIGGSTSDQRYVDNTKTWDYILQEMLRKNGTDVNIVNAGIDGQSTVGHIWNFKEWFPNITSFSPKNILFYIGINDAIPRNNSGGYDGFRKVWNWKDSIRTNSFLYKIYYAFKYTTLDNAPAKKAKVGHHTNNINLDYTDKFNYKKNNWKLYRKLVIEEKIIKNLNELVRLARELGAEPIFVTQRTARWVLKKGIIFGNSSSDTNYRFKEGVFNTDNSDRAYAEKIISNSIMKFCSSNDLYCIDGFNKFDINKHNTYDLIHTNQQGSLEIAKKLYLELKNKL